MSTHSISSASLEDSDHYRRKGHVIHCPSKHYLQLLSTTGFYSGEDKPCTLVNWGHSPRSLTMWSLMWGSVFLWLKQLTVTKGSSFCRKDLKKGFISHTVTLGYRTGYGPMEWFGYLLFLLKAWVCYQAVVASWGCWLQQLTSRKLDWMEKVGDWRLMLRILSGFVPS